MITNPEDTGIFNPRHRPRSSSSCTTAGGLCHYDQANANGILGITRARDAGFDLCQFNLHKTFSSPHCSMGMPVGASGVTAELARFLPSPTVEHDGERYYLDYDRPDSIGKVRAFHGVPATVVRALRVGAGARRRGPARGRRDRGAQQQLPREARLAERPGPRGLVRRRQRRPAPGADPLHPGAAERGRRASATLDVARRTSDFGVAQYFPSHEPWVVAEPMTLEPAETVSRADLDAYAAILAADRRTRPTPSRRSIRSSPHASTVHQLDAERARRPRAVGADLARAGSGKGGRTATGARMGVAEGRPGSPSKAFRVRRYGQRARRG